MNTQEYKNKAWERQKELFTDIGNGKVLDTVDAFKNEVGCVCCMDDRTAEGQFRLAGSGILLSEDIGFDNLVNIVKKSGIKEITSHDDCGAAKLFALAKGLDENNSDKYAKEFAQKLAKATSLPYRHIEVQNPHIARCIYIDSSSSFNPSNKEELPEGFVVTTKNIPNSHIIAQINVAINIATGNHGFGEKIDKNNPFYIFIIGKKGDDNQLENEIKKIKDERGDIVDIKYI